MNESKRKGKKRRNGARKTHALESADTFGVTGQSVASCSDLAE